jgi:hypothetical protein
MNASLLNKTLSITSPDGDSVGKELDVSFYSVFQSIYVEDVLVKSTMIPCGFHVGMLERSIKFSVTEIVNNEITKKEFGDRLSTADGCIVSSSFLLPWSQQDRLSSAILTRLNDSLMGIHISWKVVNVMATLEEEEFLLWLVLKNETSCKSILVPVSDATFPTDRLKVISQELLALCKAAGLTQVGSVTRKCSSFAALPSNTAKERAQNIIKEMMTRDAPSVWKSIEFCWYRPANVSILGYFKASGPL